LEREALNFQFTAVRERIAATMVLPDAIADAIRDDTDLADAADALVAQVSLPHPTR